MNYNFFNQYDENNDQLKMSQRQQQDGPPSRSPGRQQQDGPPSRSPGRQQQDRPPSRSPGRQQQDRPQQSFPGGPPQGFPGGSPPNFPPGPPPNLPGGAPVPPMEGDQRSFGPQGPSQQVDLRRLRRCLYRYTYVWLRNGNNFWFFPVYLVGQSMIGFRWRRNRWEYFTLNVRRISFFQCF